MSMPEHTTGERRDFEPLPPGEYEGHVGEIRVGQHKSGNEEWNVPFVLDGDKFAGRMVWDNLIFGLPQCGWKIDQFVAATKGPEEPGTKLTMNAEEFQELPCRVRVYTDEYNGEKKSKIKTWIAIKADKAEDAKPADKPAPKGEAKTAGGKTDRF